MRSYILNLATSKKRPSDKSFHVLTKGATEIRFYNLILWAIKTARADFAYRNKSQDRKIKKSAKKFPLSNRLFSLLSPNLKSPLFIIGAPRSGTTFLGNAIGSLTEYSFHYEPVATLAASRYVFQRQWSFLYSCIFYRLVYKWLMRIHFEGNLNFCEKTPNNCLLVPFLSDCFPDAKFIHIIRDGRDAALSISKKPWLQSKSDGSNLKDPSGELYGSNPRYWVEAERAIEFKHTTDFHRSIWCWRRHVESAIKDLSKINPNRFIQIYYEEIAGNPDSCSDKIIKFLQLTDAVSITKFREKMCKLKSDSIGNWKTEVTIEMQDTVNKEAGLLLKNLGYD